MLVSTFAKCIFLCLFIWKTVVIFLRIIPFAFKLISNFHVLYMNCPFYVGHRFEDDELWAVTIKGSAFLWHQVRCMVAVLFMIGQGLESADVRIQSLTMLLKS